ncbi:Cell division control protein 7 [Savitreella phatthalungensis]
MNELPPSFDVEYFSFVSPDRDTNATRKLDREEREVNTRAIEHLREQAGTIVRGYTIDRVIGSGTYSCVFRAKRRVRLRLTDGQMARRSERLEKNGRGAAPRFARAPDYAEVVKTVAIKQIYVTASRTRIKQEVSALKAIKALQCPQLLNIISAHRSKDQVILIMPYGECSLQSASD